jgi:N6-L-threonylcarbamoyladenine synthase
VNFLILGIETSCDETAASVVVDGLTVRSSVVSSQLVHSVYGGVVPELAARAHIRMIVPVVKQAITDAGVDYSDLKLIAVTYAPGLLGALLVGLPFAKALSYSLNIPFVGVNHLEGHIFALRLEYPDLNPPYLGVVLSGGHTELLIVKDWCEYEELGSTVDDASGEAFDKVAKLLGLPYPGGVQIEALARQGRPVIEFPVADAGGLDFSFSGLKTAVLYYLRDHPDADKATVAASFQVAAVRQIIRKVEQAVKKTGLKKIGVSGGVAANQYLRAQLKLLATQNGCELYIPKPAYCTDNAAMIAAAGMERYKRFGASTFNLPAFARLPITR